MAATRTRRRRSRAERVDLRRLAPEVVRDAAENELLIYASAIAFRVLSALPPFLLFALALMGALQLEEIWRDELAPDIQRNVSAASFEVIDTTVTKVLSSAQVFWLTAGFLLALWQVSSAVRAVMHGLNRMYEARESRTAWQRTVVSVGLALPLAACLLLAIAVVTLTPLVYGDVGQPLGALLFVVRWGVAAGLCLVAVWLLLRHAPAKKRPVVWVSVGTSLIIGLWLLMSFGFGVYLRYVASYESVFGALATVVVMNLYLYLSAIVFLAGALTDAIARKHAEGS